MIIIKMFKPIIGIRAATRATLRATLRVKLPTLLTTVLALALTAVSGTSLANGFDQNDVYMMDNVHPSVNPNAFDYEGWSGNDEERQLSKYVGGRAILEIGKRFLHAYMKENHGDDYAQKHNLPDVRGSYDLGGWSTKLRVSGSKAMIKWKYEF